MDTLGLHGDIPALNKPLNRVEMVVQFKYNRAIEACRYNFAADRSLEWPSAKPGIYCFRMLRTRGDAMNAIPVVVAGLALYFLGYKFYAKYLSVKNLQT